MIAFAAGHPPDPPDPQPTTALLLVCDVGTSADAVWNHRIPDMRRKAL
ncbi:hypothetical protein [Nocardia wallacei]|nr:hypothetical protein [Nocardia wallacei]